MFENNIRLLELEKMTHVAVNATGETEANGSEVHSANEHENNMIEGRDAQDGTSPIYADRQEDSDVCDELVQCFATFNVSTVAKVHENPDIRYALQRFLGQREKLKTDALTSALHRFGKYSGLSSLGKRPRMAGSRSMGVQPTAVTRLVGETDLCRLYVLRNMLQPTSMATYY